MGGGCELMGRGGGSRFGLPSCEGQWVEKWRRVKGPVGEVEEGVRASGWRSRGGCEGQWVKVEV